MFNGKKQKFFKFIILSLFVTIPFISVGYSALQTTLNISGDFVMLGPPTLYNVFINESLINKNVKEYTGAHKDSMEGVGTEKIYHWYATNDTVGTGVLDKNNVIFAEHCWQMIRTTDTGGVKMIYNGEVVDGKCLSTRGTHVGYASRSAQRLVSNYWYGTDYTYDSVAKKFKIGGDTVQSTWNETTGPGLIGKYTCKQTTETATCSTLYLIESYYDSTRAYAIPLNSNSNYSQFGTLQFNENVTSPAYAGYMYNTIYSYNEDSLNAVERVESSSPLSTNYYYADSVIWGSPTSNNYSLDNPYKVSSAADYPSLVGKYTFRNAINGYTNPVVYYITRVENSTMYYIELDNTGNHTLSDFTYVYTYGDSYIDNGDGTYTINNPQTIQRLDWYTDYINVGANKYICRNAVNNTCSDLWYTLSTPSTSILYLKISNSFKYSNGFTWDGNKYVLDDDAAVTFWNISDNTNKTSINNAHYTCFNETGECTTLSYVYNLSGYTLYYINLTGGKSVEDAKNEMLYNDNVNTTNSTIKTGVDAWYEHFMLEYDSYLEDTIFCNDRSVKALNGWDPNGGNVSEYLQFKEYDVTGDLSCVNITDQFSVSNNSAKLKYKVGLISSSEMDLLNNLKARKTGQRYWVSSPHHFTTSSIYGRAVSDLGSSNNYAYSNVYGVRPVVSLVPGIQYTSGDGSMENPYVVDALC